MVLAEKSSADFSFSEEIATLPFTQIPKVGRYGIKAEYQETISDYFSDRGLFLFFIPGIEGAGTTHRYKNWEIWL